MEPISSRLGDRRANSVLELAPVRDYVRTRGVEFHNVMRTGIFLLGQMFMSMLFHNANVLKAKL